MPDCGSLQMAGQDDCSLSGCLPRDMISRIHKNAKRSSIHRIMPNHLSWRTGLLGAAIVLVAFAAALWALNIVWPTSSAHRPAVTSVPPLAPVTCESTGRPTVTQRTATTGSATTAGRNRVRERGVARGARMRRGRLMYECRKNLSFGRRRPLTDARRKGSGATPPGG